jgi:hypothetical protein
MCRSVRVGDEEICTQAALADLVGGASRLLFTGPSRRYDAESCLCPVDIVATMARDGWSVRDGWDEAGSDYVAERTAC